MHARVLGETDTEKGNATWRNTHKAINDNDCVYPGTGKAKTGNQCHDTNCDHNWGHHLLLFSWFCPYSATCFYSSHTHYEAKEVRSSLIKLLSVSWALWSSTKLVKHKTFSVWKELFLLAFHRDNDQVFHSLNFSSFYTCYLWAQLGQSQRHPLPA